MVVVAWEFVTINNSKKDTWEFVHHEQKIIFYGFASAFVQYYAWLMCSYAALYFNLCSILNSAICMLVVVVKTLMCNCVLAFEVTIHVHELPYLEDFVVLPPFHNISHFSKLF
jgi:hypothetical protein